MSTGIFHSKVCSNANDIFLGTQVNDVVLFAHSNTQNIYIGSSNASNVVVVSQSNVTVSRTLVASNVLASNVVSGSATHSNVYTSNMSCVGGTFSNGTFSNGVFQGVHAGNGALLSNLAPSTCFATGTSVPVAFGGTGVTTGISAIPALNITGILNANAIPSTLNTTTIGGEIFTTSGHVCASGTALVLNAPINTTNPTGSIIMRYNTIPGNPYGGNGSIASFSSNSHAFYVGSSTPLYINPSGVGINNTTPLYPLDVQGSVRINNQNSIANKILCFYDANASDPVATATNFHGFGVNAGYFRYQVPAKLIAAVIWQETRFNPLCRGAAGEIGYMQIMPGSAREWAKIEHISSFGSENLFDPGTNILAGTWYLGRAIKRWNNQADPLPYALAEYNAGRSNALRWDRINTLNTQEFTNVISYPTTRAYVKTVLRNYRSFGQPWKRWGKD